MSERKKSKSNLDEEWKGYKDTWLGCSGPGCGVWQQVRVEENWEAEAAADFYCGVCAGLRVDRLKKELENLKQVHEELKRNITIETQRKMSEEEVEKKTYRQALEGLRKSVEEGKQIVTKKLQEEVRVEVKRTTEEEMRKKRIVLFGLKENEVANLNASVEGVLNTLSIASKPVSVTKFSNKNKKEGWNAPVMVEFSSERERMQVLERKSLLKDTEDYRDVFLEMDLSREEREERKKTRVLRALQRRKEQLKKQGVAQADNKQGEVNRSEETQLKITGDPVHAD